MADFTLDDLDRAILHQLEEDGRRPLREIARTVGSSEATIRARVRRMQDQNVLRIVAFADPAQLGGSQLSLMMLEIEPRFHDNIVGALVEMVEVSYVSTLLGRADLCVEVSAADNAELWTLLKTRIGAIPGVTKIETMSILQVHKLRYTSPAT